MEINNNTPNWFLIIMVIIILLALIIEAGFLGVFFYSCYVKNQCMIPFFFGMGRWMAFPIMYGGGISITEQHCSVNGVPINCSEVNSSYLNVKK
jgi:hypothetical protein